MSCDIFCSAPSDIKTTEHLKFLLFHKVVHRMHLKGTFSD